MKFLITGGAGFIGSHLANRLLDFGDVLILDNLSTGDANNISELEFRSGFEFIYGDVLDRDLINDCVKSVDFVYHLASAVGVKLILDEPVKTIETIVGGTSSVFESCARYRRPTILTSTSEVYGKSNKLPFSEDDDSVIGPPMFRRWSYASAKSLDEFLAFAYWQQMKLPITVARLFNTVGPGQTGQYGMVIPRFVQQALIGDPLTVYGDGTQTRCFCHVSDTVDALYALSECDIGGEIYNIGNDHEVRIIDLAEKIIDKTGSSSNTKLVPYDLAYGEGFEDMARRVPDISKAKRYLGYAPMRDLDNILDDVIEYYRSENN